MFLFVAVGIVMLICGIWYFSTKAPEVKQSELIPVWKKQVETNEKIIQKNQTDFVQDTAIRAVFKKKIKVIEQTQDSTLQMEQSVSNQALEIQFSDL